LYFLVLDYLAPELKGVWIARLGLYVAYGIVLALFLLWLPKVMVMLVLRPPLSLLSLLSFLTPPALVTSIFQLLGEGLARARYSFRPPEAGAYRQRVEYSLPFSGLWFVGNGGPDPSTSHSWDLLGQRYAYDFLIVDESGKSHRGQGRRLEDYYAFGAPVLAPADGVVVAVQNHHRDCPWTGVLDPLAWSILGNYVVIRHAEGEYSLLAHLRRGSVRVRPGERVRRGQVVGECGNSGHSTEPHLHFQVQDHPNAFLSASLPVRFRRWCRQVDGVCQPVEEGFPVRGERVANWEGDPESFPGRIGA
jgi:murein DD-endopeptidase MepM/ murein hydrolase activator NlpD